MSRREMGSLGVVRWTASAHELAIASRGALDRELAHDAELVVGSLPSGAEPVVVLGAFQRASEAGVGEAVELSSARSLLRRGSGGAAHVVGPGSLWVQLALRTPDVLGPCTAAQLVNRHVRPLLRAITRVSARGGSSAAKAVYLGRDWIRAGGPIGFIGFATDRTSRRSLVEAILAVETPFSPPRSSFRGHPPRTLAEAAPHVTGPTLGDEIARAFRALSTSSVDLAADELVARASATDADAAVEIHDAPWVATTAAEIGIVGAGRARDDRLQVGGELMVARDALAALERRLATSVGAADVGAALDQTLGDPAAVLFGVRDLAPVQAAILAAARATRR